jgi:outer membrane receptor protein involved in Fe transport
MNHRSFSARVFLLSTVSILIAGVPTLSHAQQTLPEITVSDERVRQSTRSRSQNAPDRSENAGGAAAERIEQNVPASLTVLPRATLEDAGINTVQDLPRYVPNFLLSDQGSPRLSISTIRGIGTTVRNDYFNSSLGIYLDGVPLSTAEFNRRLGDIAQVEVLRGPQGTLFGHNTPAGVINLTSRAPTREPKAEVLGTFGNKAQREGSVWVSGPLSDPSLTGRLFFDYAARDGFTKYLSNGDTIDDLKSMTGSGAIRYQPNDRLTVSLSGSLERVRQGAYGYLPFDTYQTRVADLTPPNQEIRNSRNLNGTVKYDLGPVQFLSITGVRSYDVGADQDLNYNQFVQAFGGGRTRGDENGRQFSQEFRLSGGAGTPLTWFAGAFLQTDTVNYDYLFGIPAFGPPSLNASIYDRREIAGLGELTWNVIGGLDLTAGMRLSREHHQVNNNAPFQGTADFTLPTPKFRAAYRFDNEKLVYVSATRGARSGGFNRFVADDRYDSEFLWSYETGFKTEWLNRTFTLNGAVFYIDWRDQQIRTLISPGVVEVTNAGKSHSQGFELEASWRPIQGLELSGFVGVTNGRYDEFIGQDGTSLAGHRLVNTPDMNAGLAAQYRWPLGIWPVSAVMRAEYQYTGDHFFDPENRLKQEGYGIVNLRAGIEHKNFSATFFVRNLLDQDYRSFGYRDFQGSFLASDVAIAGQTRLIGVTLTGRY